MATLQARSLGGDISTSKFKLDVRDGEGNEASVECPMEGATIWNGAPAFDVNYVPYLLLGLISRLEDRGWVFSISSEASEPPPSLVFSVRQHDLVFVDDNKEVIRPALSWQCNQAQYQSAMLNRNDAVRELIGRCEPRYLIAKAPWAMTIDRGIVAETWRIMTTGDWAVGQLTGRYGLSTSDALSNGLLAQRDKSLAAVAIRAAGLSESMFPDPFGSDEIVGQVDPKLPKGSMGWQQLRMKLAGWNVGASLGDNHAGATACLHESDYETMVASFGTSGTTVRSCEPTADLEGGASRFEFFRQRLLLCMVPRCAQWYGDFLKQAAMLDHSHATLDKMAFGVTNFVDVPFVPSDGRTECYPALPTWGPLSYGQKIAAVQMSIVVHMLRDARVMLNEVTNQEVPIKTCVLIGGLSRSALVRLVYTLGLAMINEGVSVVTGQRDSGQPDQDAAYGAMITAMQYEPSTRGQVVLEKLCPTGPYHMPDGTEAERQRNGSIRAWLERHL